MSQRRAHDEKSAISKIFTFFGLSIDNVETWPVKMSLFELVCFWTKYLEMLGPIEYWLAIH